MSNPFDFTLALVGAGNMGSAMLGGWFGEGLDPALATIIDPSPPTAAMQLIGETNIRQVATAPADYRPDVLVLAVKPQILKAVLASAAPMMGPDTVAVSIAAGVTIDGLQSGLGGEQAAIVRAMPNTPSLIRQGITVACANRFVTDVQHARIDRLLKAVGSVEWVQDEALIDAVTAVSGSGPAYVFHLVECMARAGVEAGLPAELAMKLARETVSGAGGLLARSPETPETLRKNVTSPNGTTAAALAVLMDGDAMAEMMTRAIAAAKTRSQELSSPDDD